LQILPAKDVPLIYNWKWNTKWIHIIACGVVFKMTEHRRCNTEGNSVKSAMETCYAYSIFFLTLTCSCLLKCPSPLFFMISYKNIACVKKPDGKRNWIWSVFLFFFEPSKRAMNKSDWAPWETGSVMSGESDLVVIKARTETSPYS
jgi:hypothetical protein